jgi:hypothetical protein
VVYLCDDWIAAVSRARGLTLILTLIDTLLSEAFRHILSFRQGDNRVQTEQVTYAESELVCGYVKLLPSQL